MTKLTVENVSKKLGSQQVLSDLSFEAESDDIIAIIGPSGGGKTTLLRCILGEIHPDKGRILIDGKDVTRERVWKRGVGIVYQRYALFPHMNTRDNVGYGLNIRRQPRDKVRKKVDELLDMVHLTEKAEDYPERLSGGERQRVALARSLAVDPRLLLLDEAFTALDATTRHSVISEVRAIVRRLKIPTVLVTHDQEEAFVFATRVLVLHEGQIVASGSPDDVMAHTHPFIQDFVKMALFHRGTVEEDARGRMFVPLENGSRIPIGIPGVKPGDLVQVMVKKTGETESIEVWRHEPW